MEISCSRISIYKYTNKGYDISIFVKKEMINVNHIDRLEELIKEKNGTLLTLDLKGTNIPREYLKILVERGKLERVYRGVYVSTETFEDVMYYMQHKYPKIIYSHETALYFHGLTDRTPMKYSITVPSDYKVLKTSFKNFKIYYIKMDLYNLGMTDGVTSFGNNIKVYNVERTICDMIRSRNIIDIQIVNESMKRYVKLKTADYGLLGEYAKLMNVENIIQKYMEVLL